MLDTNFINAICNHMNNDHPDANVAYVKAFNGMANVVSAKMTNITETHMYFDTIDTNDTVYNAVSIAFERPITDEKIHATLISMLRKARKLIEEET